MVMVTVMDFSQRMTEAVAARGRRRARQKAGVRRARAFCVVALLAAAVACVACILVLYI